MVYPDADKLAQGFELTFGTVDWVLLGGLMPRDKRLAELARSLHRASERLWLRVANSSEYEMNSPDIEGLQTANTQLNRAITKLKLKTKK